MMSWIHYIDNEVPALGEWDSEVHAGGSTIVQSAVASFPERGSIGLRVQTVAGNVAYVTKANWCDALAPGGAIYIGQWIRIAASPALSSNLMSVSFGAVTCAVLYSYGSGGKLYFRLLVKDDPGGWQWCAMHEFILGRWYYVAVRITRATGPTANDGSYQVWVDGVSAGTLAGIDNYDLLAAAGDQLRCGITGNARDNFEGHLDELKIATSYPEPYVPAPADEYLSAARTVVLWRGASGDSREFADYCVSELSIPRANLIRLDNAPADETLASYGTFYTAVEADIGTYLALHPTVAANCMCFLIGYAVPGYFLSGASVRHSAASRLMNYGTAFSSGTANPLYDPDPVQRLTKTDLGGEYLACRIDADTLAHAKDIIDRGLVVSALGALADSDTLYCDEPTYRASLPCQRLRILTAEMGTLANDAFVFGDPGTPSYGAAGSRAAFVDDSGQSASTLRAPTSSCHIAFLAGYAAALGNADAAEAFDAESFFEMLRIGGTLAEAVIVAVAKLDYTAVPAGSLLMAVAFQKAGYNIYRGPGGIQHIDWLESVACARSGQQAVSFAQVLAPDQRYVYGVRAVSQAGVEEHSTHVVSYVEIDEEGALLPPPLARPTDLTVAAQPSGELLVGLSYFAPAGFASADGFDILCDYGTGQLDLENPLATIDEVSQGQHDFEVTISRPETSVLLAARPRKGGLFGPVSKPVLVPAASAPAEARIL